MKTKKSVFCLVFILFGCFSTDGNGNYTVRIHNETNGNIEALFYECNAPGLKEIKSISIPPNDFSEIYFCDDFLESGKITINYLNKTHNYAYKYGKINGDDVYVRENDF